MTTSLAWFIRRPGFSFLRNTQTQEAWFARGVPFHQFSSKKDMHWLVSVMLNCKKSHNSEIDIKSVRGWGLPSSGGVRPSYDHNWIIHFLRVKAVRPMWWHTPLRIWPRTMRWAGTRMVMHPRMVESLPEDADTPKAAAP